MTLIDAGPMIDAAWESARRLRLLFLPPALMVARLMGGAESLWSASAWLVLSAILSVEVAILVLSRADA